MVETCNIGPDVVLSVPLKQRFIYDTGADMDRRQFLAAGTATVSTLCLQRNLWAMAGAVEQEQCVPLKISLAQWSLHRRLFGRAEQRLDNLDFALTARKMGVDAIEYVNVFFMDKAEDEKYLTGPQSAGSKSF